MDYYKRSEVSNSDLSWLKNQLNPSEIQFDPTDAYYFGSLIDAMITEKHKINYIDKTFKGVRVSTKLFDLAAAMEKAFWKDDLARTLTMNADTQKISVVKNKKFKFSDVEFELDVRCKWDIWNGHWGWGGDIKSTTAKTQAEFEAACLHFDYDRQRAWYMDIENSERDVIIGISKANLKVFKVFINRNNDFYKQGRDKYLELAFRWYTLFGQNKPQGI